VQATAEPLLAFFAVHAHFAVPKELQNAHELQKIFAVAAGDRSQADKAQGNATFAPLKKSRKQIMTA